MKPKLSEGEWTLMKLLWDAPPKTITQLTALLTDTNLSKRNVITMLDRLEAKGVVRYTSNGRAREYWPAVEREDVAREETARFLDRVFNGRVGLLLNTVLNSDGMTEEEIEELSDIIRKAREERRHD